MIIKFYLLFGVAISFLSCKSSPEETAIKEFVNRVDATTSIDKKFKAKRISLEKTILGGDSLEYYKIAYFNSWIDDSTVLDSLEGLINSLEGAMLTYDTLIESSHNKAVNAVYVFDFEFYKDEAERFEKNKREIEEIILMIRSERIPIMKKYLDNKDEIFGYLYSVEYSFENPLMDNRRVERKTTFALTPDKSTVIEDLNE